MKYLLSDEELYAQMVCGQNPDASRIAKAQAKKIRDWLWLAAPSDLLYDIPKSFLIKFTISAEDWHNFCKEVENGKD